MSITAKELYDATMRGEGILAKHAQANPDMPVFLLIGQDNLAAELVEKWAIHASIALRTTGSEGAGHKVQEARQIAEAMYRWPVRKSPD